MNKKLKNIDNPNHCCWHHYWQLRWLLRLLPSNQCEKL